MKLSDANRFCKPHEGPSKANPSRQKKCTTRLVINAGLLPFAPCFRKLPASTPLLFFRELIKSRPTTAHINLIAPRVRTTMAMIGKLIGNYQITAELAQGRLGPIYRGQTVDQAREVLIKTINLTSFPASTQVQLKARFRREIFVQRQLQHPNIVRVYDFLNFEDSHYVVTEFVQASSLRELLNRQGLPTVQQAVYLIKQALAALDYAHNLSYQDQSDFQRTGLVHSDIKPSNLLLDPRGRLRLTDFGIVNKVLSGEGRRTALRESDYLAPEQLRGATPDAASDIYSLGMTLYEMLTGRVPFTNWSQSGALDPRRLSGEAEAQSLTEIRPDVPPTLALVVARAIRRNSKERYASATDFLRAILSCEPQINTSELTTRIHALKSATQSSTPPTPTQAPVKATPSRRITVPFPKSQPEVQLLPPEQPAPEQTALDRLPRVDLAKHEAAAYAAQQTSALPRTVPVNVAPPEFAEVRRFNRERWLVPSALAAMFVGALAGAYFFSSPSTNEGRASDIALKQAAASPAPGDMTTPTPVPTADPAQHATPRSLVNLPTPRPTIAVPTSPLLDQARLAEQQEHYQEAIKAYEDYAQANPTAPFAAVVRSRVSNLRLFNALLTNARAAFTEARYDEAKQKFGEALKLRPTSLSAQSGLREAAAKLPAPAVAPAASTREGNRPPAVEQEKENKSDAPGTKAEATTPDKQPRSEEAPARPRSTPKPTPTPDSY
jgi:serine/threonine-protein kinase